MHKWRNGGIFLFIIFCFFSSIFRAKSNEILWKSFVNFAMLGAKSRFFIAKLFADRSLPRFSKCDRPECRPSCRNFADGGGGHAGHRTPAQPTSGTLSATESPVLDRKVLVEHKIADVKQCSNFKVRTRGMINVHIVPTETDTFTACVWMALAGPADLHQASQLAAGLRCDVGSNFVELEGAGRGRDTICVTASNEHASSSSFGLQTLQLQIPHQSLVDIETTSMSDDLHVIFEPMELLEVTCKLRSGKGIKFIGRKLKCSSLLVDIYSQSAKVGDVVVNLEGSFLGKLDVKSSGAGFIRADLLRCSDVSLTTMDGSIDVAAVYASSFAALVSGSGDVRLRTIRANCEIALHQGDMKIGCLDGALVANVQDGNATVFMNNLDRNSRSSIVCERGDVHLTIPPECNANLHLEGLELDVDLSLNITNDVTKNVTGNIKLLKATVMKSDSKLNCDVSAVATTGTLTLRVKDWLQTICQ